jgi:hypothetical protein
MSLPSFSPGTKFLDWDGMPVALSEDSLSATAYDGPAPRWVNPVTAEREGAPVSFEAFTALWAAHVSR